MMSLRSRLLWRVGAGQVLILAAFNVGLWWLAKSVITQDFDQRSALQVNALGSLIDQEGPYVEFDYKEELAQRFERQEKPDYYQIWVENVGELDRSYSLEGLGDLDKRFGPSEAPEHWNAPLPDGREGRYAGIRFDIGGYEPVAEDGKKAKRQTAVIVMAASRESITHDMARFGKGLLLLDLGIVIASALAVGLGVGGGLRPVRRLASSVAGLGENGDLEPLRRLAMPSELKPLSDAVQTLHVRLQKAIDREKRLSGHIAHELRTPISELRAMTEVALYDEKDMAGLKHATEQSRDVAIEMENIVGMLLRIWRQEAAGAGGERGKIDVILLIQHLQSRLAQRAQERGVRWSTPPSPPANGPVYVLAEAKPLELVLTNLLDNAVEHCPEGSEVTWQVGQSNGHIEIQIRNPQNIDPDELSQAQSGPYPHAGLGLSLSQRVSDVTGFALETGAREGRWTACLSLPAYREENAGT